MHVSIENALGPGVHPGVSQSALERLDDRVTDAHAEITDRRADGAFGYAALDLPETVRPAAIRDVTGSMPDCDAVLTVGIGGSALGAKAIARALDSEVDAYFLDNVDPALTREVLDAVCLDRTVVHVVSKSGTTTETLANFLVVREAMATAGVDWTERTVVTTGDEGPLRRLAHRHGLPLLDFPTAVPGRFAALSPVGLVPAALQGHDVEAILEGAREADVGEPSLFDNPAYAYGATSYALQQRGAGTTVMMPYAQPLGAFAEWFRQLWAESLGKDGVGQLPATALGRTDQHSQLQRYLDGPRDAVVTLLRVRERDDHPVPASELDLADHVPGDSLGEMLDAGLIATEESLVDAGRPTLRVEVDSVDERSLGALLYGMETACVMAGELYGVPTFRQPAVETTKQRAQELQATSTGSAESDDGSPESSVTK